MSYGKGANALSRSHLHTTGNAAGNSLSRESNSDTNNRNSRRVPRYIPLPDTLYRLRHRFPTVFQSLFLECTRCRRWVAVEVLSDIPDEVLDAEVAEEGIFTSCASSTIGEGSTSREMALCTKRKSLVGEAGEKSETGAEVKWHSPRLREHMHNNSNHNNTNNNPLPSTQPFNSEDSSSVKNNLHNSGRSGGTDPDRAERRLLTRLMQNTMHSLPTKGGIGNPLPVPSSSSSFEQQLFIPNPLCFTCDWLYCQKADLLSDLRQTWLGMLYKTTLSSTFQGSGEPKTTSMRPSEEVEEEENGKTMLSSSSTMPLHALRGHQDALNAELARELNFRWSGRLLAERERRRKQHLPSQGPTGLKSFANNAEHHNETHDDDSDDIHALLLQEEAKAAKGLGKVSPYGLESLRNAWVRTAMRHLLKDRFSSHPFYGEGEGEGEGVALSAFCWVVCENCGKLRRVAQPFPGGAPFICALSRSVGSCRVAEVDGLIACTADLTVADLRRAALASSALPAALRRRCARPLGGGPDSTPPALAQPARGDENAKANARGKRREGEGGGALPGIDDEPLVQELRAEVGRRVLALLERAREPPAKSASASQKRTKSHTYSGNPDRSLIEGALPMLRDLSARMRKRTLGSFSKQIMAIPQEIRAKRDDVLKACFQEEPTKAEEENVADVERDIKKPSVLVKRGHLTKKVAINPALEQGEATPAPPNAHPEKRRRVVELGENAPGIRRRKEMDEPHEPVTAPQPVGPPNGSITAPAELPSRRRKSFPKTSLVKEEKLDGRDLGETQSPGDAAAPSPRDESSSSLSYKIPTRSKVEDTAQPVPRKRGRPRKQATESEVIYWVQCDLCNKWRIVSHPIQNGTTFWECKLRDDKTTCAMIDDEVMLKRRGGKHT